MATDRIYAIGDVHGHLDTLRDLYRWIEIDQAKYADTAPVVFIGDLIDRGPDSAGVIAWLLAGLAAGQPWVILKGNHDRMMSLFLSEPSQRDARLRPDLEWLDPRLGGNTTLASYGVNLDDQDTILSQAREKVPQNHLAFLSQLRNYFATENTLFVHAGISPGIALAAQAEDDLLWIRGPFHKDTRDHGSLIVHGHTPVDDVTHYGNRINIDTGVAYGRHLSAIVIEGSGVWDLRDGDRQIVRSG